MDPARDGPPRPGHRPQMGRDALRRNDDGNGNPVRLFDGHPTTVGQLTVAPGGAQFADGRVPRHVYAGFDTLSPAQAHELADALIEAAASDG